MLGRLTEGHIHVAARRAMERLGFRLLAGQYPGGSDDSLPPLNVVDPVVACDRSPDPRRHSDGKLVPDLVAIYRSTLVLAEMKPGYSRQDREKLAELLGPRRADLDRALKTFAAIRGADALANPSALNIVPCLGFADGARFVQEPSLAYILVRGLDDATVIRPQVEVDWP